MVRRLLDDLTPSKAMDGVVAAVFARLAGEPQVADDDVCWQLVPSRRPGQVGIKLAALPRAGCVDALPAWGDIRDLLL